MNFGVSLSLSLSIFCFLFCFRSVVPSNDKLSFLWLDDAEIILLKKNGACKTTNFVAKSKNKPCTYVDIDFENIGKAPKAFTGPET